MLTEMITTAFRWWQTRWPKSLFATPWSNCIYNENFIVI